jgi:hypothetical protein
VENRVKETDMTVNLVDFLDPFETAAASVAEFLKHQTGVNNITDANCKPNGKGLLLGLIDIRVRRSNRCLTAECHRVGGGIAMTEEAKPAGASGGSVLLSRGN